MPEAAPSTDSRITELRVSGHLMLLDPGLYCILHTLPAAAEADAHGLPGVRISPAPEAEDNVEISGFRADGWLTSPADAALVRVTEAPAQVLVTVYQAPDSALGAPNLQVLRLDEPAPVPGPAAPAVPPPAPRLPPPPHHVPAPAAMAPAPAPSGRREVAAHVQRRGDLFVGLGEWIGDPGSERWIEGFAIAPQNGVALEDIEYQAVLGRGWLSPWVEGGQFCGSRGMALPVLGLCVRLRGAAAEAFTLEMVASFVDGTRLGPVGSGEACESPSLAPLEAFRLILHPRAGQRMPPQSTGFAIPATAPQHPAAKADPKPAPAKKAAPKKAPANKTGAKKAAPPKRKR